MDTMNLETLFIILNFFVDMFFIWLPVLVVSVIAYIVYRRTGTI